MGGEEGVRHLAGKALHSKVSGKDVDAEDRNPDHLVILQAESSMKGARGKETSKESKAEGCRYEAETVEETNTEPVKSFEIFEFGILSEDRL